MSALEIKLVLEPSASMTSWFERLEAALGRACAQEAKLKGIFGPVRGEPLRVLDPRSAHDAGDGTKMFIVECLMADERGQEFARANGFLYTGYPDFGEQVETKGAGADAPAQSDSGAGEHQDVAGIEVHQAPSSSLPDLPSPNLELPVANVPPADFLGRPPVVWTAARKALLLELRQAGLEFGEIFQELLKLPGARISGVEAVKKQYWKLPREIAGIKASPDAQLKPWTDERVAKCAELRAQGWKPREILPELLKLPGREINQKAVENKVYELECLAPKHQAAAAAVQPKAKPKEVVPQAKTAVPAAEEDELSVQVWTSDRIHTMATLRGMGADWDEVRGELNKLPGPMIIKASSCANVFERLRRSGRLPRVEKKPSAGVAEAVAAVPSGGVKVPMSATIMEVEQWAACRGLVDAPLGVINAKRTQLGLPPFKVAKR